MEQIVGILLALCFSGAYIPQVYRIIRNKSSKDVSLGMLLINGIGYFSGMAYLHLSETVGFWLKFNYQGGFIMTLICIGIWFIYRNGGEVK